ncbi:hypothetical protein ACP3V3_01850 [Vibrio sp. PNB22_3_1]
MKTLELGVYGITITYYSEQDKGGCAITTDLKEPDTLDNDEFNAAVDGIESMILAHFAAGVDITCTAYLEGIETTYNAIGAQFS